MLRGTLVHHAHWLVYKRLLTGSPATFRLYLSPSDDSPPDAGATEFEPAEFASLLAAAKDGDSSAINEIIRVFYPRVKRAVHVSLATDMRANRPWLSARFSTGDIVQEVFRSVLTDLQAFGGHTEDAFAGYLAMMVRNRIIDAIRYHQADKRDGRLGAEPGEIQSSGTSPVDLASANEQRRRYEELLREFPMRLQLLLRARLEDTASFRELAEQLGYANETAARRAFFDAQATLAVKLENFSPKADETDSQETDGTR